MFRTTTPRTRRLLSIPVAFAAAAAISVPLTGVAHANHIASLTMTPVADSAAVGTCNQFTVTLVAPGGGPVPAEVVDVTLTENPPSGTATIDFCVDSNDADPPTSSIAPNAPATTFLNGTRAEFTTDADGKFVFGVTSTDVVTIAIAAFYDANGDNNDNDAIRDTSTKTFTAGGQENAETLTASPTTDTNITNEPHTVNVTVKNAAGDPMPGVAVEGNIVSGPNVAQVLSCEYTGAGVLTNQQGVAACTYTGTLVGTDNLVFWVNQNNADNNIVTADTDGPNPDAGEPSVTATKTYFAPAPAGIDIDVTCADHANDPEVCENPLGDHTEVFTAVATVPDGPDADSVRDAASGILIRWTVADPNTPGSVSNPDATVSPTSCTTDATGKCSTTLNKVNTSVASGAILVTGTIAQCATPACTDTGQKSFVAATGDTARRIDLQPDTANTAPGGFRTFTATTVDRFGNPVPNVQVTFTESGPGRFANGSDTIVAVTNAAGQATAEVTSSTSEVGFQTVTATITGWMNAGTLVLRNPTTTDDECEQAAGASLFSGNDPNLTAGKCSDSSTNTIGSPTPTATPSGSTSATPTASTSPTGNPACTVGTPSSVSLAANVTQITAGNSPTLTGTVLNAASQPCASTAITIYKKSYGEASYTALATVSTDANGKFTLVVRPLTQTAYGANTASNAVRSNIVVVRVYTRVNITTPAVPAPATSARAVTNPVTFTGSLLPGYGNVAVGLGTFVNGQFVVLQQTVTNAAGGYSLTRTLRAGQGVYVIFTSAHQGTDKGSKSLLLSVS